MKFRTKLLFVMKLTTALILFTAMHLYAKTSAQIVSYSARNAKLEQVFRALEQQTGYGFFYQVSDLKNAQPVSVAFKNLALPDALKMILKNQTLEFFIDGKTVFITPKKKEESLTQGIYPGLDLLQARTIDVRGTIKDENGKPIAGASVVVKGSTKGVSTNENGEFELKGVDDNATLVISGVNIERLEIKVNGREELGILKTTAKISELADVTITAVNTGYQQIPKERATGSFVQIDSALINRSVSTNIIDRLEGVTSGMAFNKNIVARGGAGLQGNQSNFTIRGRSTLNSNPNPLVVLDNFPYDGNLSTLNPDDIESITILKDAAAAAIWGTYSGNGVIIITTKKGKYNQPLKIQMNAFVNVGLKPDLYYTPQLTSSEAIDVELFLFNKGNYNSALSSTSRPFVTPVVEILARRRSGLISAADSTSQIDALRNIDTRVDMDKYLFQKMINQHYDVSINGGSNNQRYYFSTGHDRNQPNETYNNYTRSTLNAKYTFLIFKQKLELNAGLQFQESISNIKNNVSNIVSPYFQFLNTDGTAAATSPGTGFRQSYLDTAGQGKLLDWYYRPYDEMKNGDNETKIVDYHFSFDAKYKIMPGFDLSLSYNYNKGFTTQENYRSMDVYTTRNQINTFTQINFASGVLTRNIPLGGIIDRANNNYESNNVRAGINYTHTWNGDHALNMFAGSEMRKIKGFSSSYRLYGYDPETSVSANIDYVNVYPNYVTRSNTRIPSNISNGGTVINTYSYYALAGYNYKGKYGFTGSVRRDESNLFGVNSNMKGVPLYSAGLSWQLSKESFYNISWLPLLKFRVTMGYQGNYNSNIAAVTTIVYGTVANSYGTISANVSNLPNPMLRWEKVNHVNVGLDFGSRNSIINGSVEYYFKNATDLLASTPLDPTTGATSFNGNSANLKTKGIDLVLNSLNMNSKKFQWRTSFLLNYASDKVSRYLGNPGNIGSHISMALINPLIGKPLYSIYAYTFAGLDATGLPQGMLDGQVSKNYGAFTSSTNYDNLKYIGPANPTVTGGLLNSFTCKQFDLSFNMRFSFGYYFRRPSINYASLYNATGPSVPSTMDFTYRQRWQNPGDEKITNVPAMVYPNANFDLFYNSTDILVEKGDHIRLQDIKVGYTITKKQLRRIPFESLQVYGYANNLGIIYRENKFGIDPEMVPSAFTYPNPKSFALGIKVTF